MILLAETRVFRDYLINSAETSVFDLFLPLLLNVVLVFLIVGLCAVFIRRHKLRQFLVATALILLSDGGLQALLGLVSGVTNHLPLMPPAPVIGVAGLVLLVLAVYWGIVALEWLAGKLHWPGHEIAGTIAVAACAYFLAEFIPAAVVLGEAWPQFSYHPPALATAPTPGSKPDIYYILLEDYTSQTILKNQLDFDNSSFLRHLTNAGFYNVPNAYANYPYTVNSVASTFNADYLSAPIDAFSKSRNQTLVPYFTTVKDSPVIRQLKGLGYTYDLLGDWYETSNYSPLADHTYTNDNQLVFLNHTYGLNNFTAIQVQKNILSGVISTGLSLGHYRVLGYNAQTDVELVKSQLATLRRLVAQPAGGRFIFSQILVPHNYYPFNADGSKNPNPGPDNVGEPAATKYTNEVQYINSQIEPIIDEIKKNSHGQANIILQSDEGPQVSVLQSLPKNSGNLDEDSGDMTTWPQAVLQEKFGVLASYYIPGATPGALAAGANPINIFRLVLNTNFGSTLPYLPQCSYGFPQGEDEAFVYKDLTSALTGNSDSRCPENGNFIHPGTTKKTNPGFATRQRAESGDSD